MNVSNARIEMVDDLPAVLADIDGRTYVIPLVQKITMLDRGLVFLRPTDGRPTSLPPVQVDDDWQSKEFSRDPRLVALGRQLWDMTNGLQPLVFGPLDLPEPVITR